jgi:hypothetical protein
MATVSFTIPEEVKEAFDKAFADDDKDAIIADLMRRAVRDHHLHKRRETLFRQLTNDRALRPTLSTAELQKIRSAGRP